MANLPPAQLASFRTHLQNSERIIAVVGAGLSASSGLPTFRGAGGLFRSYDATQLATCAAFESDPGLVWQFYSYRRHMALNAEANHAHYALAELARRKPGFVTLSQNVDGLSQRAAHPERQLKLLHGNLFDIRCERATCGYVRKNDFTDPITPALAMPKDQPAQIGQETDRHRAIQANLARKAALVKGVDISNADVPLYTVPRDLLPHCPQCKTSLLRPAVVWFGEMLPLDVMSDVDAFFDEEDTATTDHGARPPRGKKTIDLCLIIGTSLNVYPAAGYADRARSMGARIAVVNTDLADAGILGKGDWFFQGDAAEIVPEILESVVGEVSDTTASIAGNE